MRDRGKRELQVYNNNENLFEEFNPNFPCKKHPSSSSSSNGICAYCLSERLIQLVCPECGEKRLSPSCCSEIISNSNEKISSLLEFEKGCSKISTSKSKSMSKSEQKSPRNQNDDFINLKRSNSISELVDACHRKRSEIKKFWKIGRLFRKRRENNHKNNQNVEEKFEFNNGVLRSENGGLFHLISSTARASSVSTENFVLDSAKRSCFSESEARISNFDYCENFFNGQNKHNNNIFSLKESEFISSDDPSFIDLKLGDNFSSDHSKVSLPLPLPLPLPLSASLAGMKRSGLGLSTKEFGFRGGEMFNNGGGSCRVSSVSERDLIKCRKSYKVWRWFMRHHTSDGNTFGVSSKSG